MSAYVVEKETIDRMVFALVRWGHDFGDFDSTPCEKMDALGKDLWTLNVRAVAYRYPSHATASDNYAPMIEEYKARGFMPIEKLQGYKAIAEWLYQCSEGDFPKHELFKAVGAAHDRIAHQIIRDRLWGNGGWGS